MSEWLYYPRPTSLIALGSGHGVVESSAGTGKTFLLEHLFVDLILTRGLPVEAILVVTFTEKATAELVLRVRKLLERLADLRPDDPKAIAGARGPADDCWVIDDQARARLHQALLAFDRASIFTIHGFCQRVLREHAFVQGRLFDEELVGEGDIFAAAFHEVLRTKVATSKSLAAGIEGWLASGESMARLEQIVCECNQAGATTVRPLFDERRLAVALGKWQPVASVDEVLKQRMKDAGLRGNSPAAVLGRLARVSDIVVACQGDSMRCLAAMQRFPEDLIWILGRLEKARPDPSLQRLAEAVRQLQQGVVPLAAVLTQMLLPWVQQRADERKRAAGLFDFADMLKLVARALADPGPAGLALLSTLRQRYRHALIDEFQDTDEVQWSIFRRIFVDANDGHALTVIGDPKQAIYGFRGADVQTYLEASEVLRAAGGNGFVLDRNFRSTARIIEASNLIFDQGAGFFRRESGIGYEQPALCGRPELALVDGAGGAAAPVVVFGLRTQQSSLHAAHARAAIQAAIVGELGGLLDPASSLRLLGDGDAKLRARDIFILTFTNGESQDMGRALAGAGIPFAYYKLGDLFSSPEAADVLALLRAVACPEDRNLRSLALLTGFFGLDLVDVAAGADWGSGEGPAQLLLHFAAVARLGNIPALFASIIDDSGIVRREVFADGSERALTNTLHVLEILQAEWMRTRASLLELADTLDAFIRGTRRPPGNDSDLQRLETDKDAVQILTVHKAKGLEAGVVFLYGGTGEKRGKTIHTFREHGRRVVHIGPLGAVEKQRVAEENEDENSRLLYVAMTRARYRLYLPHYPTQLRSLSGRYARVNRRLDEILGHERCHPLFDVIPVDDSPQADSQHAWPATKAGAAFDLGPIGLTAELLADVVAPAEIAAIKKRRRGFLVTSYTAIKRAHGGFVPVEDHTDFPLAVASEPAGDPAVVAPAADDLPGGPETGVFLHEMLERVSLSELERAPSFADWLSQPSVAELVERLRRRHGRPERHGSLAACLVYNAYTTPVRLGRAVVARLASVKQARREMEFLFPMPEQAHPLLSRPAGGSDPVPWRVERGLVKGFVDLMFEHEGKVFVCDWKSDRLPSWDAETVARHCAQNYDIQTRVYTMAVLRLCRITTRDDCERRFGGVLFLFLRARRANDDSAGILFRKPEWKEILSWEEAMLGQDFWGMT